MTYEETRYLIANTPYLGGSEQEKVEEAILMAIEALEKQIPKKPTHIYMRCGMTVEGCCKRCDASVEPHMAFCNRCGQALDWSE